MKSMVVTLMAARRDIKRLLRWELRWEVDDLTRAGELQIIYSTICITALIELAQRGTQCLDFTRRVVSTLSVR